MSDGRSFARLRELFDRLVEMPAAEREEEIVRATAGDPALEAELRGLLDQAAREETTPLDVTMPLRGWGEPPVPIIPGFRVHRRIGRGGSATVYLADQERSDFTRPVALKVVDCVVDSTSLWRVREEQRILARLEHAGIARLYDTGVTSLGQPYLAMEHVEGETIVEHCRARRLPIRARLELFLAVLDAVGYAHEHGIVHRDLKPANILVSARGEAKLLDFGIAKLVAPGDQNETRTLHRAMTPAYASPEQMRGGRITPASDIYSLGVVLYELLANALPFDLDERNDDPPPPSAAFSADPEMSRADVTQWCNALRGGLDAVVLKTLRYDPQARYASAAALADDLRCVLAGRRVAARHSDRLFRIRAFARRHRVAAAALAAAAVAALVLAGMQQWRAATPDPPSELALFYDVSALRDAAQKLERFDAFAARDGFRRAALTSRGRMPDEALAWDGVARAESALGEVGLAADAARRAGALVANGSRGLPAGEAERLRAAAQAANHQWSQAIPALEGLFAREPERLDVGMALVSTLAACGRTDAADTVLGRLRQLPAAADPRVDLLEAEVAQQLSEFQRAAAAAARARVQAQKIGATALALRAERLHADAIGRLDRREEARRALESIATRDVAAGLHREAAAARLGLGTVLLRIGKAEETQRALESAVAGLRAAHDERGEISARVVIAVQTAKSGEIGAGIRATEAAVADARRIGDRWAEGYALSQKMVLLNWADDEPAFAATIEPTLAALRDSGNRLVLMGTLGNLAIAAIQRLELDQAETYLLEADALSRRVGSQLASASIDSARGYLDQTRGDFDLARKRYVSALEKAGRAGVPLSRGTYLADLASLELAADRPDEAAARATAAIEAYTSGGDLRAATEVEGVLAWTDARRGDVAGAKRRLARLQKAAEDDGSDNARFTFLIAEARVAAAAKEWRRAIEIRRQTVRMATEWNTRGLVIEQQAALAEALRGAGERRALERLVAQVVPEAEQLGLHGIVRELRALVAH